MSNETRRLISGLPHSTALAWEILKWLRAQSPDASLNILVPDNTWALTLKDDLGVLAPNLDIFFLPALETDLLRNRGPSVLRRMERIRFLSATQDATRKRSAIFLITAEALTQRHPISSFWSDHLVRLNVGQDYERTRLTEELVELGYTPAELVETPTEFAVRGSIVDIFPPGAEFPARVELFEDRVQSLRLFHSNSQRRIEDLETLAIMPAREFVYPANDEALPRLKSELRLYLDEQDWPKADRDAILDRIQQRAYFPTIDYWAPMINAKAFEGSSPAFLQMRPLAVVEAGTINTESRVVFRAMERNLESARVEGDWVPQPARFLNGAEQFRATITSSLDIASLWLSTRQTQALLTNEPSVKLSSEIRTHDLLASKLSGSRADPTAEPLEPLAEQTRIWAAEGITTVFMAPTPSQLERLQFLLGQYHIRFKLHASFDEILATRPPLAGILGSLEQGFVDRSAGLAVVLDEEIFGTKKKRRGASHATKPKEIREAFSTDFSLLDLKPNDFVVHNEHGIGRYLGLKTVHFAGIPQELVEIEYKGASKLLVPVTRLDTIHKHSGGGDESQLDKLGGQTWEGKKAKVKKELRNIAGELLHLYSKREMSQGPVIRPEKRRVDEFAETFAYVETPDQATAIEKTLKDMEGPRPMDRLICGDVGYGKTEVAIRAAHAAVSAGFQVAVLVPTTILAVQHESTFKKRLTPLGVRVAGLSRFKSNKEAKETLAAASDGKVDVIIGTHRLLSNDVGFPKLGLLIVDEEQRFGVVHKEKIKKLRANVHVLTLTATPIPRTLNMAMSGLKEISIITTPPADRLSVRTHIARKKWPLIQEAIQNEIKRGGQVFYLHNRIQTMPLELEEMQKILPGVKIETVHGQMEEHRLEERMMNFYEGRTQVLLTTAIIESGLDIPNANTLIVDRADSFGLSQLYQIRGRVGRSSTRAYAYFLVPDKVPISKDAEERLAVLDSYQELGSGFHIASHDMDIRGSGEILGGNQSGHLLAIGMDAYMELLNEAIAETRGEPIEHLPDPEITLGLDTTIPENYVPEVGLRLMFYRKLASAPNESEVDQVEVEIEDRFGPLPASVKNLLAVMRIKCQLKRLGVRSLSAGKGGFSLGFDSRTPVNPAKIVAHLKRYPSLFLLHPDGKLLIKRPAEGSQETNVMQGIEGALTLLESWCG